MSITSMVAAASTSSSNSMGPPSKRQKIVIKPRAPLIIKQPATAEAQAEVSDVKVAKTTSQEATGSSIKDIQHFVLKLKERLEKSAIKEIIMCVRSYKEKGDVRPLAEKLHSFSSKLRPEDFDEFRSFVRGTDDKRIFDDVCVRRRL